MKSLGLSWDEQAPTQIEKHTIEGLYLMKDGQVYSESELEGYCHICLEALSYHHTHDAEYCASCDEWRGMACDDPACNYCITRPERPSGNEERH